MPRQNQMRLSMAASSGITVVNMIKIAEKMLIGLQQHLKQLLYFLVFARDGWRSHVSFCALCPHFHAQLVLLWSFGAAFQNFCTFNFFFKFPWLFWLFLTFFCHSDAVSKFTLSSSTDLTSVMWYQCFYLWCFLNTTQQQKLLCILQVAQMWSYWSNSRGTASYEGKSGLLAPLGISVLMCSTFGILLPSHLLQACWQVEKPSICIALVCVHIKVLQRSGVVSLV